MNWIFLFTILKMIYRLICYVFLVLSAIVYIFWFLFNVVTTTIPFCSLALFFVDIMERSKAKEEEDPTKSLPGSEIKDVAKGQQQWSIANRGASYDAPENSLSALELMIKGGFQHVFLDVGVTECKSIVIANRRMLARAGLKGGISSHTLASLQTINITEHHAMGPKFKAEHVITLAELAQFYEKEKNSVITIYLLINESSRQLIEKLSAFLNHSTDFAQRIILVSSSPIDLYQLHQLNPEIACGLWYENSLSRSLLNTSTLLSSIYGAIIRNIVCPVIGISVVFLSKEEFNTHVRHLWSSINVRPIVYNINMANEKRYFQKTMKTQYLTDTLRSEPQLFEKIN